MSGALWPLLFVLRTFLSSFWSNTLSLSCSWALWQMVSCSLSFLWSSFAALYDFPSCQAWPRFVKWAWVFSFCLEDPDPQRRPATVTNPPGSTMLLNVLKPCGFFLERKRWNINEDLAFQEEGSGGLWLQCLLSRLVFIFPACRLQLNAL